MNEMLDEEVVARLRSALDEVTADTHGLVAVESPRERVSAGRWMAVAAAVVLVVSAVTAITINRAHAPSVASVATELPSTAPVTEPTLIRVVTPWFRLVSEDLVPGEEVVDECCQRGPATELVMAWARDEGAEAGMLTMRRVTAGSVSTVDGVTTRVVDGAMLSFASRGLTGEERDALVAQVVPGSELPYVLPADGWQYVASGFADGGNRRSQMYIPASVDRLSGNIPTVSISVGSYRGELELLTTLEPQPVNVAGTDGWEATETDGSVTVIWPTDGDYWASLHIDPQLADRADALIAGVVQVSEEAASEPTVDTVLAPAADKSGVTVGGDWLTAFDPTASTDPAVGMPAPIVDGIDYEGNAASIHPTEGPQLVTFQAHWCPHCAANIRNVIEWMANGTIPLWLPVTLVSTAESPTGANYPADKWLQELGWTGRVMRDSNEGNRVAGVAAQAYGANGYPFFVVIGVDGTVLARTEGELTKADMQTLLAGLPDGPADPVGRLAIPTLDFNWLVLDNTLGLTISAQAGPVLASGPLPGEGIDGEISIIWGHRTTHGAPFADIDTLVSGDTITWTGADGTSSTFEVIGSAVGEDTAAPDGTALELRAFTPKYTSRDTLIVFARRTA